MCFSATLSKKAIIPPFILYVFSIGLIIRRNQISVWGSIGLSIISFFAFRIILGMLFDDAAKQPAEGRQSDENVGMANQEEDEPKPLPEAALEAAPKETETLLVPRSPVLVPGVLSPIIGRRKPEDKAKAELKLEEKTEATAEAKGLGRRRKGKTREGKRILEKQPAGKSQPSDEPQFSCGGMPNDENQPAVYGSISSDDELNLNPVLPKRHKNHDECLSSSAELGILNEYWASIKGGDNAAFIRNTQLAILSFTKTLRAAELKGSEMLRDEEIKARIPEARPSLQLGPKIEWGCQRRAVRGVKKRVPTEVKVGSKFAGEEHQTKKAVSPTSGLKALIKDDKTPEMPSQAPLKTSQFTIESIEKSGHKDIKQEIPEEMETNEAPRKPSTEAVAPISSEEIKEITKITALAPGVNETKGAWELEKLFPPLVQGETKVKTKVVATPKIPETRADIIKEWLARNGQLESTKITESTAPLLNADEAEGSQVDEIVSTDTTQTVDQEPAKTATQSVETIVVPALIVSKTKEIEELESLSPKMSSKIPESESIAGLNNELEASGAESPTLAGGSLTALVELEDASSTEDMVPSTVEQGKAKERDEAYESDDLVQELEELLFPTVPEPGTQSECSSQVQEEPQLPCEVSPAGPETPQVTIISTIQGASEPENIQEYTEIIAPAVELTADEAVLIDTMMMSIDREGNIVGGMDTRQPEFFSNQAQGTEELPATSDSQTGRDDLVEFLDNFDDNSLRIVSYNDPEPTAAPHEVLEPFIDMEDTTRPFDLNFDLDYRGENIDLEALFNQMLDQDDPLLCEDQVNACQLTNIGKNGPADVANQTMAEVVYSECIPTTDGMEIDQIVFNEDGPYLQEILAASNYESFSSNQTQVVPDVTVAIPTIHEFQGQQNGTGNEFQSEMPQWNFTPQLDSSLTTWHSVDHFTSISPESNTFVPQPTTEQVSYQETINPELSIEESALLLLQLAQETFTPQSYAEQPAPIVVSQGIFNLQLVHEQQSTLGEMAQQTFTPQVEIGQISPKLTEQVSGSSTSVGLSQGTIIPPFPIDQPIPVATTQEPSRQITIEQPVSKITIEQSPTAVPLQDMPQSTQEPQISQDAISYPIFSTVCPSLTTINNNNNNNNNSDGTRLDIPQKSLGPAINTLPLIFALQVTEKTSNKRCVELDGEDDNQGTQANMEVTMITKRPIIPLRKKALETITESVALVETPKKPKSTTGIKIITTAPTQSGKEVALKKRTKIEVALDPEELKAEPNYDSAKVNMQQQLNKTTTKLQAMTMEKSVSSARQRGMEIDAEGFFQLGLAENKPRRRC